LFTYRIPNGESLSRALTRTSLIKETGEKL